MSNVTSDSPYPTSANEPKVHPLVRNSFVFVPSAGMRLAPEILVLELYREIFFPSHYESTGGKELDPDELADNRSYYYSTGERAVLHALRGRRRKSRNAKSKPFFAPAYPSLAKKAWFGKNRERVIINFLLGRAPSDRGQNHEVCAPISQHLWHKGETEEKKIEQKDFVDSLIRALVGQNSYQGDDLLGKEIMSVAIASAPSVVEEAHAKEKLYQKTRSHVVMKIPRDTLSQRIFRDLLALCKLEKEMPRMQWLQILMTFLRFSLPMWLLAQMRITSLLHGWLLNAVDKGDLASSDHIESEISHRNLELLHPTLTPTREIFERTELYMKCRVELNILLYLLMKVRDERICNKRLEIRGAGAEVLTLEELLLVARDAVNDMKSVDWFIRVADGGTFQDFLTREAEKHSAWRDPRGGGQGKNIDEFFRVLYRDELGDEAGGFILVSGGRGRARGFRVFPGQLLLKTLTFLASHDKQTNSPTRGGGQLVLEDVENHFKQYGIDFSCAADARPLLMRELQAMGLLTGSPDAGSSVAVAIPY